METTRQEKVTKEWLLRGANIAGIEFDDERLEALVAQIERLFAGFPGLDELALGEIEPASVFVLEED